MKHVGSLFAVCVVTVFAFGQTVLMAQDVVITQNPDCDTDAGTMVACGAEGSTAENWFARNFYVADGVTVNSIHFGSANVTTVSANIFFSIASGPGNPDGVTLTPVGTATQALDAGPWYDTAVDVPFDVPAGSYLVVEFQMPDTGTDAGIWPANTTTATETTYLKAADCAITTYTDVAAIGFPDSQIIMCLNATSGNFDPCSQPLPTECTADVDGDLVVAVGDVLLIIGNWGVCGDGTFRPVGDIAPLPNGDCCVDVSDVLAVIGSWGEDCLPRGACCYNTTKDPNCSDNETLDDCTASGGFYLGDDSLCADGECVDGACCIDESTCLDGTIMWVCDNLGGIFRGAGTSCADVSCETGCSAIGCQSPDLAGHGSSGIIGATSDTNPGAGFQVADTFNPTVSGVITEVCWWGLYIDFGLNVDCGVDGPGTGDNFTITYYLDDGDSTIPGTMFAGPFAVSSSVAPTGDVIPSGLGDIVQYAYSAYHSPVKVQAGACYWISIVNQTTGDCYWLWETAPAGDERSAQDNGGWGSSDFDLGFCVNIETASNACIAFVGPCCLPDQSCQIMTAGSCAVAEGSYGGDNLDCGDVNNCLGACCFDIATCLDNYYGDDCIAFGATFMGTGTVCADVDCDIQPPGCPDGTLFSQNVHGIDDPWTAGTASDDPGYPIDYERAESVNVGSMSTVTVFGLQLYYSGSWGGCSTDFDFNIRSYVDASGLPGTLNAESLNVPATKTDTGELYAGIYPLMKWDMNFSATNVDWLSLQSASNGLQCWFLWMSSGEGDGTAALNLGTGWAIEAFDLNICID